MTGNPEVTGLGKSCRHPCKSLSRENVVLPKARSGERARRLFQELQLARVASRHWFLLYAEPDIHSLSWALGGRHRRLSLCSLPVLKQFGESLGSRSPSLSRQPAGPGSLRAVESRYFFFAAVVRPPCACALPQVRSLVRRDPQPLARRPSCEQRQASLDWHSLSAFPFHRPGPDHGPV